MDLLSEPRSLGTFATAAGGLGPALLAMMHLLSPGFQLFSEAERQADLSRMHSRSLPGNSDSFDFIIVGGGVTGSALANKLSERYTVLVLEAGPAPSPLHLVPTYAFLQFNEPAIDWAYKTVPQRRACFGLNNNESAWPSGRLLGGSSLLNALHYLRGNVQGFDEVAEKTGDKRWKLSNILKYYTALEDYNGWFPKEFHGKNGPTQIEKPVLAEFTDFALQAGVELGYSIRDPNGYGPNAEGFAPMDLYMRNGRRTDAYQEFLEPVLSRSSLSIRKFSHVTKILFENNTNTAYGVEYMRHGKKFTVRANFEVIVSAGAVRTPQLLMLSGIGPREHLQELGIETRLNLPVGQYLQDKYGALIGPFLIKEGTGIRMERDLSVSNMMKWAATGRGLVRSSLSEATWAIISETARKAGRATKPDVHTYILSVTMPRQISKIVQRAFNFRPDILDFFALGAEGNHDSFIQLVTLNSAVGRGYLKLKDTNPFTYPEINPRYLESEEDSSALLEGIKLAVKLVENTTAMSRVNGRLMPKSLPGCVQHEFKSDAYYDCAMRHVTLTAFKYAGTAPIGINASDLDAVVDSHLRVLGAKNLRVVDASVLQQRHSSVNAITCRMLGQLAADIIRDDTKSSLLSSSRSI